MRLSKESRERMLESKQVIKYHCPKCHTGGQQVLKGPLQRQLADLRCPKCKRKIPKEYTKKAQGNVEMVVYGDTSRSTRPDPGHTDLSIAPTRNSQRRERYGERRKQTSKQARVRTGPRDAQSRRRQEETG